MGWNGTFWGRLGANDPWRAVCMAWKRMAKRVVRGRDTQFYGSFPYFPYSEMRCVAKMSEISSSASISLKPLLTVNRMRLNLLR